MNTQEKTDSPDDGTQAAPEVRGLDRVVHALEGAVENIESWRYWR